MVDPLRVLVEQLIEAFPDSYPSVTLKKKEFAFRAGQVDICRRLKEAKDNFNLDRDLT
jgi:hypothetical protein